VDKNYSSEKRLVKEENITRRASERDLKFVENITGDKNRGESGDCVYFYYNGIFYYKQGMPEKAKDEFKKALNCNPDFFEAYFDLGMLHRNSAEFSDAAKCFANCAELEPNNFEAVFNYAYALEKIKKYDDSETFYLKALELNAASPEAYFNLGNLRKEKRNWNDAEYYFIKALKLLPKNEKYHTNLGISYHYQGKFENAVNSFNKALEINPDYSEAKLNLAATFVELGKIDDALNIYNELLLAEREDPVTHYNKALALLLKGDFENGFKEYEWRLKNEYYVKKYKRLKFWNGERLDGKTLLVIDEQGFGDFFQFSRYLRLLKNFNGRIIFAVRPALKNFAEKQGLADEIVSLDENVNADYKIFLLSLPIHLNHADVKFPYLTLPANDEETEPDAKKKIGIVWRGNPNHMYDFKRTVPLELFLKSLQSYDGSIVSLQYDITDEEKQLLQANKAEISEKESLAFENGSPVLNEVDLIISVDTAAAHYAAAAGKKVWLLLPHIPDWRWGLSGEETKWHPTMKLFRQTEQNNWDDVFTNLSEQLKNSSPSIDVKLSIKKIEALEALENKEIEKGLSLLLAIGKDYPDDFEINFWLGHAYSLKEENEKALEFFAKASEIKPEDYNVKNLMGICEMKLRHFSSAEIYFKSIPDSLRSADIWNNLGFVLQRQRKLKNAEECFRKAIGIDPSAAGYYTNFGNNYYYAHLFAEALEQFDKALEIEKDFRAAHVGKCFVLLMLKDFENGFKEFEWTLDDHKKLMPKNAVKWNGENGDGKSIFIYGEQGLGDVIQFARFLPKVKELGFEIIFDCDERLKPLFKNRSFINQFIRGVDAEADYYSSLLALPKYLNLKKEEDFSLPSNLLNNDDEKKNFWRNKINGNEFNVGIVWATSSKNKTAEERNIPVKEIGSLLNLTGVTFYPLHQKLTDEEASFLNQFDNAVYLTEKMKNFTDTAAIIENLDLVISIDTSIAHLAGSLGKETWLIPSAVSEWRWGIDDDKSYWYPTMKIFRPAKSFEWDDAIREIAAELKNRQIEKNNAPRQTITLDYAKNLLDSGKLQEAVAALTELTNLEKENYEAYFFLGYAFQILNNLEEAAFNYSKVLQLDPEHFNTLNNLGVVLKDMGKPEEAVKCLTYAKILSPDNASVYNNLGIVFDLQGKFEEAVSHFKKALECRANYSDAKLNLANALQTLGKYDEAILFFDEIIESNANRVGANFNKSLTLLSKGDYKNGFDLYEWRTERDDFIKRHFSKPRLNTKEIENKVIFVYDEQGLGDTIQFGRFIKPLSELGANVILQCHNSLVDLMRGCAGVKEAIHRYSFNEPPIDYDYHIPLLSLPKFFGTDLDSLPADTPYIDVDPDKISRWRKIIGETDLPKIGIVWEGKTPVGNAHRSCPVEFFTTLAKKRNARFFSLQVGEVAERDREKIESAEIVDLSSDIESFGDTAAIIKNMDLIITIDTSAAHLAGALNANTWTILSFKNDWRWKPEGEISVWYPSMKLIRQKTFGDWQKVFEKINFLLIDFEKDFANS